MKRSISIFTVTLIFASVLFGQKPYMVKTERKNIVPTNPLGTGVQIDFPFLGYADTATDPELFKELTAAVKALGVKTLRFPGGCSAYAYSYDKPEPLSVFKDIYYACDEKSGKKGFKAKWSNVNHFFKFCKATGCRALYQLNIGNYYDPKTKQVYAIAPIDSGLRSRDPKDKRIFKLDTPKKANYDYSKLKNAVEDAKKIAQTAKDSGVKAIWEFGNEDYTRYSPETYIKTVIPFYHAIQSVDRKAKFAVCCDGLNWSDWRWSEKVIKLAAQHKLPIDYASFHVYLSGGGGGVFSNGAVGYKRIIKAYSNIRYLHSWMRKVLNRNGYKKTKLAITEGNVTARAPMLGKPFEHGMGRALAEAAIYPDRIKRYSLLVQHDLVRSGPKNGTWFCRIFYEPDNPVGKRYELPTAATIMGKMAQHASRKIIFDSGKGVTVSQSYRDFLVTAGNASDKPKDIVLSFNSLPTRAKNVSMEIILADNLDTPKFTVEKGEAKISMVKWNQHNVKFTLPKYSFAYFIIKQ